MTLEGNTVNAISVLIAAVLIGAGAAVISGALGAFPGNEAAGAVLVALGLLALASLRVANEWERAVILRVGKRHGVRGPGLFFVVPVIDTVTAVIDQRIQATPFATEKTLTRDTTPVDVDAIVFWMVHDPARAALQVGNYRQAVELVAQTSLREIIGAADLSDLLSDREATDQRLQAVISRKTEPWGVSVRSVEIRDVVLPSTLQDAMSRQAQAQREKAARVTLASAEREVAHELEEAAKVYDRSPTALRVLQIQRTFEMNNQRGTTILLPTELASSMASSVAAAAAAGA